MTLLIPAEVEREIRRAGEAGYPHEICGVLVGEEGKVGEEESPRRVVRAVPAPNRTEEDRMRRYFLDPLAYARIEREADARGESVLGFYHTHPDHPALPSETDRLGAAPWPGFSFLILAVEKGKAVVWTSWRLDAANGLFVEEKVETTPRVVLGAHARMQAERRGISEEAILQAVLKPEQVVAIRPGREIRQSRLAQPREGRVYLLRVVVDERPNGIAIVTAYRTGKIEKYWRKA